MPSLHRKACLRCLRTFLVPLGLAASNAHAQSNVTLYGIVDAGIVYTNKTVDMSTGASLGKQWMVRDSGQSASRFGVRGTEDLGGGIKANFNLESGIDLANGGLNNSNGNLFGRQAWLSVSSNWGELKAGLQYSPFFWAIVASDARNFSQFGSGLVTYADAVLGTSIFTANAMSYTTPKVAGLTGSVLIALGGASGNFQAGRQYSGSLTWAHGPLSVDVAYFNGNSGGTAQTPVPTTIAFVGKTAGVVYHWGDVTAKASITAFKTASSFNEIVYSAGFDAFVLPTLNLNAGVWATRDRNSSDNHSVMSAIGAEYYLSKRTTLYSQFGVANNHGAMNTGLSVSSLSTLYAARGTTIGASAGVRHTF
ncbi:porin [Paraburkholderia tropica]|uniref:porin n=1 Tax=Paraburkholderia tropica TaxID=92647 RepID=UPI002ABE1B3D|nr:porin [Paraburkholderia tropica]